MALLLSFYRFCSGLLTVHGDHYGGVAQRFALGKFRGERYGFFDPDLSAFCLAVGNVGQMDSDYLFLVRSIS